MAGGRTSTLSAGPPSGLRIEGALGLIIFSAHTNKRRWSQYWLYLGLADGMPIARVWARRSGPTVRGADHMSLRHIILCYYYIIILLYYYNIVLYYYYIIIIFSAPHSRHDGTLAIMTRAITPSRPLAPVYRP